MRPQAKRLLLLLVPVMIVLGVTGDARAQVRSWGIGVGVGYGPYWGGPYVGRPGWGPSWGWGPTWGLIPTYYQGFYGNGLSMYGPPVPTGKPIPGVFGGGDSTFFALPPLYPGWGYQSFGRVGGPAALPPGVVQPGFDQLLSQPKALELDKPAAFEVEVRLPKEDAKVFINGAEADSVGAVRNYATPAQPTAEALSYDLRAEWTDEKGQKVGVTKKVIGRPGERVVVEFK